MERVHRSVMVNESIEILKVSPEGAYADFTFGEGGHSEALLAAGAKEVWGIDRDSEALERYRASGTERNNPKLHLCHGNFSEIARLTEGKLFDGIVVDLGVSTRQLMEPERGFTFSGAGPLDMRMDRKHSRPLTEWLEQIDEDSLGQALEAYADIYPGARMARLVLDAFRHGKLHTTQDLADLVGRGGGKRHGATTLFMALRMLVNEELQEIQKGLPAAIEQLKVGGRLAVISFHSVEDRLVKNIFKLAAGRCACGLNPCLCPREKSVEWVLKKALPAAYQEVRQNPRSRSAKLRCVEKLPPSE